MNFKRLIVLFVSLVLLAITTGQAMADTPQPRQQSQYQEDTAVLDAQRQEEDEALRKLTEAEEAYTKTTGSSLATEAELARTRAAVESAEAELQNIRHENEAVNRITEAEKAYTRATASGDQNAIREANTALEAAKAELQRTRDGGSSGSGASAGGSSGEGQDGPTGAPSGPSGDYKSGERFKVFDVFNVEGKQVAFGGTQDVSPIASVLVRGADFMVKVAGVIGVLVFVIGALLMITAQGREDQIQMGKDTLFYAIIGLVIVFFSYLISVTVQAVFFK